MNSYYFKASLQSNFEIEVTTVLGCSVNCLYCPQDLLLESREDHKLSFNVQDFKQAIDNIDIEKAVISWTGYSEATLHSSFPDFLRLARKNGLPQVISTTLAGREDSCLAAINYKHWINFSLHLPDDKGLMRGLTVTPKYLELLDHAFSVRSNSIAPTKIICFGDNLHPEVKQVVDKHIALGNFKTKYLKLRGRVSTRCDSISSSKLTNSNIGFVAPKVLVSDGVKDPFYMCDKQKMNSPVLLPDGSLNICSFDYSLSQILGNLKTDKLSTIWNNYKERIMDPFLAGELHPCTKCEHYQLIEPLAP